MSYTLAPEQTAYAQAEPQPVRLKIENGMQEMEIKLDRPLYLGRSVSQQDIDIIDLEGFGGVEKGVSRCHVRLSRRDGAVMIEDLGSLNGTFINAQKIAPYTAVELKDSDYLHLGLLLIQILTN